MKANYSSKPNFTEQQKIAISLMKNDLRYVYTLLTGIGNKNPNLLLDALPYFGVIIDGVEDWIKSYNNSNKIKLPYPTFNSKEEEFYGNIRNSIKLLDGSYDDFYNLLKTKYEESDEHFSSVCKPIAKSLKLYDIFGVDICNGIFCGNTILTSCLIPDFQYGKSDGRIMRDLAEIGGKYVAIFNALTPYSTDKTLSFDIQDFGGFKKSPVGNEFSHKFVLFTLLCQINYVLFYIEKYIKEECSTKLRFMYIVYYYAARFLSDLNNVLNCDFTIDTSYVSDKFRNSVAHYKIGIDLKNDEIIKDDPMFGLCQKYLNMDYYTAKAIIKNELSSLANQITEYLGL